MRLIDRRGDTFGRLTVDAPPEFHRDPSGRRRAYWPCACLCGGRITVRASDLGSGRTKSCGCLNRETSREVARSLREVNHRGEGVGYKAAHYRVVSARGKASGQPCHVCGSTGRTQWAHMPCPMERREVRADARYGDPRDMAYCSHEHAEHDCYMPLCVSCHTALDRRNAEIRKGGEVLCPSGTPA